MIKIKQEPLYKYKYVEIDERLTTCSYIQFSQPMVARMHASMRFEPLVAAGADTNQKDSQGVPFIHTLYEKAPYQVDSQIRRQPDLITQADANGKNLLDLVIEKKDNPLFDTIAEINQAVKDQKGQSLFRLQIILNPFS